MSKLKAIDLFCGVGGSSSGAARAGIDIVAGFDYWDKALQVFSNNFPNAKTYNDDIRKISPKVIRREIGNIDLILASPECTNHSLAKGSRIIDEDSRMTAFEVIKFAEEFKPQWIIIENVIQMKSWNKFEELLEVFYGMGYSIQQLKLNSKDFLVPQSRVRLFMIFSRTDNTNIHLPNSTTYQPASSIINFDTIYNKSLLRKPSRAFATIQRAERAINIIGNESPFLLVYYGTDGSGGWQRIERPLRTITTLDRFALVEPSRSGHTMRMLQPEELKLAMGFQKRYRINIPGITRRDQIKLIGNGVCPPVMQYLVNSIID
jgi:DNA (cytosine-5)-methyltransferase 1